MTNYIEYGVNLTDNQKMNLASAINNKTPLTLRIKHSNLTGNDENMVEIYSHHLQVLEQEYCLTQ